MSVILFNFEDQKTKEFLASIGGVVVCLNHLEYMIEFFISELINAKADNASKSQSISDRITVNLDYIEKLDLLRSLIVERYGVEKAKDFIKIYNECKKVCEKRNDISHSLWSIEYGNVKEGIDCLTTKINKQKAFQRGKQFDFSKAYSVVKVEELKQEIEEINRIISDITLFIFKLLK